MMIILILEMRKKKKTCPNAFKTLNPHNNPTNSALLILLSDKTIEVWRYWAT